MTWVEYAALIGAHSAEAVRVPFKAAEPGNWSPRVAECHANVDRWVTDHAGCRAVRGWVTFYPLLVGVRLTAHSVVEDANGNLLDVTPLEDERYRQGMRFVRHPGSECLFHALRDVSIYLDCPDWVDP